jgi:adenylate cyclase
VVLLARMHEPEAHAAKRSRSPGRGALRAGRRATICDVHRVRLAQAFERSGIPLEAIGAAVASGHLSFGFVDQMFVGHAPLSGRTFREIADDLGLPLETLTRLYAMWGMALHQAYIAAPMLAAGMSAQEVMDASSAFSQAGIPMMERQLSWLLRRKIEHNTFQLIVEHVESSVEAAGAARPAARLPAICFIDLSGYTALTEELGDQAAAERAGSLGTLVQELAHGHGGRVVKLLGDGAMLLFPDPPAAVACGLEMVGRVEAAGLPPARVAAPVELSAAAPPG